jgi:hypothetical protein
MVDNQERKIMKRRMTITLLTILTGALVACLSYGDGNPPFSFQWCMEGPDGVIQRGCEGFDYNGDMDVDLQDWAVYTLECPSGPPC